MDGDGDCPLPRTDNPDDSFVLKYLTDHNYDVRLDNDIETYRTCL